MNSEFRQAAEIEAETPISGGMSFLQLVWFCFGCDHEPVDLSAVAELQRQETRRRQESAEAGRRLLSERWKRRRACEFEGGGGI